MGPIYSKVAVQAKHKHRLVRPLIERLSGVPSVSARIATERARFSYRHHLRWARMCTQPYTEDGRFMTTPPSALGAHVHPTFRMVTSELIRINEPGFVTIT